MAKNANDQLEALKQRKARLAAQIQKLEASETAKRRKLDARRKIIVGGAVLAHAERSSEFGSALKALLRSAVTRDIDRRDIADLL
jgi:septal ring factor EnvC (AmiA/AmiB activator)